MRLQDKTANQSALDRMKHQIRAADKARVEAEIELAATITSASSDDLWTIRTELQTTLYELIRAAEPETLTTWFEALTVLMNRQREDSALHHALRNASMYARTLRNRYAHA